MAASRNSIENILQDCLALLEAGEGSASELAERYPDHEKELQSSLEMARLLHGARQSFDLRPGYLGASRQRLQSMVAEMPRAAQPSPWSARWASLLQMIYGRSRVVALAVSLAFVMVVLILGSGAAMMSTASLPGDTLYPVKTALEELRLVAALSPEQDARLYILYSERRAEEAQALVALNRTTWLAATLDRMQSHMEHAITLIAEIRQRSPVTAATLARSFDQALEKSRLAFSALMQDSAPSVALELQRAADIAAAGGFEVQALIQDIEESVGLVTGTPSPTSTRVAAASNTPVPPSPSSTNTALPSPTATLELKLTATQTPTEESIPTLTATATRPVIEAPPPTPTETKKPTRTAKPTKTPRPKKTKED